jgi:hypothetical protein
MWFAALSDYRNNHWFLNFSEKIMKGNADVIGLLKNNPFSDTPPQFLKATVYNYKFADFKTLFSKNGSQWWTREKEGLYMPVVSRAKNGKLFFMNEDQVLKQLGE